MKPLANRERSRETRYSVRFAERASRILITGGGIGTILAVSLIMVFLVWVVAPLFAGASIGEETGVAVAGEPPASPLELIVDESQSLATTVTPDGGALVVELATGTVVARQAPPAVGVTAARRDVDGRRVTLGFQDGTVRTGRVAATVAFPVGEAVPAEVRALAPGESRIANDVLFTVMDDGTVVRHSMSIEWSEPIVTGVESPIVLLDFVQRDGGSTLAALTEDDSLQLMQVRERRNLLTGKTTFSVSRYAIPYEAAAEAGQGRPETLLLAGFGESISLLWTDGRLVRIDTRDPENAQIAQSLDLLPEDGVTVTAVRSLPGRGTLMVGDSSGHLRGWFSSKPEDATTVDGILLVNGNELARGESPVVQLAASTRTRLCLAAHADGAIRLHHVTTGQVVAETRTSVEPAAITVFPKEDGIGAWADGTLSTWALDPMHPEASLAALFAPVWYEGYPEPAHVWQSSSGTDSFEPKLGMAPLVFGTIKATLYSMLFGAPLAILAAIYTSEFMDRRLRTALKSLIEMMASLPSVVLGFLGALVIAPFVQEELAGTLAAVLLVPVLLLVGAYLWQLIPRARALRVPAWLKGLAILVPLPLAIVLARGLGPVLESLLFDGDIGMWLDGQTGTATGGWAVLLLPAAALVVVFASSRVVEPMLRARSADWGYGRHARVELLRFGASAVAVLLIAFLAGKTLNASGMDPRGGLVGTYVQRNALIVGFVMGFALVPIIYTLAEDALSSVPDHLRLASLGAGATPWQTASRVVIPTAMSGIFSALMMGLGRAVGETMIVLMAAGNTPILEWNPFNGFRTLSANIAVELPEAVKDSTHYRTLFLAALVLFAMTFVLNTVAELVRQRFRKRAYQL